MKDFLGEEKVCLFGERARNGLVFALCGECWRTRGEEGSVSGSADVEVDESSITSSVVSLEVVDVKPRTRAFDVVYEPKRVANVSLCAHCRILSKQNTTDRICEVSRSGGINFATLSEDVVDKLKCPTRDCGGVSDCCSGQQSRQATSGCLSDLLTEH